MNTAQIIRLNNVMKFIYEEKRTLLALFKKFVNFSLII